MRSAAVYASRSKAGPVDRAGLIFDQLHSALTARAEIERHDMGRPDRRTASRPPTLPGLSIVRPREPVIALGCIAHTALADFEKRTLLVDDLDLGGAGQAVSAQDIEQFVWSCTNTLRIVALGGGAWQSVQLLPIADRRSHKVPPLRLAGKMPSRQDILVIDHCGDTRAGGVVEALQRAGMRVACTGSSSSAEPLQACWSNDAVIHVHVGDHTLDAEEPRLVDSWRSERLALQLANDRRMRRTTNPDVLTIENEVNGIVCATPEDVVSACRELYEDGILRQKLLAAGQSTIAPLMKGWGAIADDLLS